MCSCFHVIFVFLTVFRYFHYRHCGHVMSTPPRYSINLFCNLSIFEIRNCQKCPSLISISSVNSHCLLVLHHPLQDTAGQRSPDHGSAFVRWQTWSQGKYRSRIKTSKLQSKTKKWYAALRPDSSQLKPTQSPNSCVYSEPHTKQEVSTKAFRSDAQSH